MWMLKNKETGEIVDPRNADFALSPNDILPGCDDWDVVLSQNIETDIVEGFECIEVSDGGQA